MIPLEEAQERLIKLAAPPGMEMADTGDTVGRYLARDIHAKRTQPAKDLSAMDGYALAHTDLPGPWEIVGESAAGTGFADKVLKGQAVRIFTGAPLPPGTDTILIQENALRDAAMLSLKPEIALPDIGRHVRKKGSDFSESALLVSAGTRLNPAHIGLAAMAGHGQLPVNRKPRIAVIQTGDELVEPGQPVGDDQIPASNGSMLAAMLAKLPCDITGNRIVPDDLERMQAALCSADADIIVTIGGASVGDHDLVRPALEAAGAKIDFWKVAMRPGKPVLAGTMNDKVILGLPGNPVSAYVTAFLFLLPLVRHMAGSKAPLPELKNAKIDEPLSANAERAYFIRAIANDDRISPLPSEDSAILASLSRANALIYRPAMAPACNAGEQVGFLALV